MGQRPDSHLASNPQTKKNEAAVHQYLDTQGGMGEIGSGKLQTFKDVHADFEKKNAGHRSITPNEMQSHLESHPNWPRKEQTNEGTEMQKDIDELVEVGFTESEASKIVEASLNESAMVCANCGCKQGDPKPGCKCKSDSNDKSGDNWVKASLDETKDCKCDGNCKCGLKEETQEFFEEFHADHGHLPEAEQLELMEAFSKTLNEETFVDRMAAQMGILLKQSQTSPLTATNVSEAAYKAGDHVIVQGGIHYGKRGIVESTEDTTLTLKGVTDKFGAKATNIDVAVCDVRK